VAVITGSVFSRGFLACVSFLSSSTNAQSFFLYSTSYQCLFLSLANPDASISTRVWLSRSLPDRGKYIKPDPEVPAVGPLSRARGPPLLMERKRAMVRRWRNKKRKRGGGHSSLLRNWSWVNTSPM